MLYALVQFLVCAAVIIVAGSFLTRYADVIAERTGLGRMLAGMVLLAVVTSLPELTVDVSAVRMGYVDMALGDLLGSSLANLMILGVLDLLHRSTRGGIFSRSASAHALSGTMSMCLTALVGLGIVLGNRLGGVSFLGVGVIAWAVLVVFVLGVRVVFYDQKAAAEQIGQSHAALPPVVEHQHVTLRRGIIGFAIAALAIFAAGPFLAHAAGQIADRSGLGGTFVGTTFVALCTSLPELITSLAALRMGAIDMAVGNIFGSNAFNMVMVVPLDLAHPGTLLAAASPTHVVTCLAVIVVSSIAIIGQLYHVERRIRFIEPDALMVVLLVLGALATIYFMH